MCPRISIIVPNYNHAQFLDQRLSSIFNQSFTDFELIFLDDCSTDNSAEIFEKFKSDPRISHVVFNKINSGSTFRQWQKGIQLAKGEYVWIAESDDYADVYLLERLYRGMELNNFIPGVAYCQTADVDINNNIVHERIRYTSSFSPNIWAADFNMEGKTFIDRYLKVKNVIPNASAVLFKKSLVKPYTFSTDLLAMRMAGDWFFWIKLLLESDVVFVAETLNYFRVHDAVSRTHNTAEKVQRRLLEEKIIRDYICSATGFGQQEQWHQLYKKWFKEKSTLSFLLPDFYKVRSDKLSSIEFLKLFMQFRRKGELSR